MFNITSRKMSEMDNRLKTFEERVKRLEEFCEKLDRPKWFAHIRYTDTDSRSHTVLTDKFIRD